MDRLASVRVRVAVVDIGTNSTRLLIADVGADGALQERHRESIVTRLGAQVDATGRLQEAAMQRVFDTLARMRELIDAHDVTATTAVLTSAVRDAANGPQFTATVRERFGLDARTIGGDEEAALTFAGATSERADTDRELLVVDIGGGSTEFVIGRDGTVGFHVSTQAGVVRQTERHIDHDPPRREEIDGLRREVAQIVAEQVPQERRRRVEHAIAVAGTATSCAAIELGLDPYDRALVHGHVLRRAIITGILGQLSRLTDAERRAVTGLQPDRAPTIVAGVAMLLEVVDAFGLDEIEVSEHDILRGAALRLAAAGATSAPG
jgi:exopolyphosphatase/guanosine-5'-triphosphate,3'-diphosphate pyrophosphatase